MPLPTVRLGTFLALMLGTIAAVGCAKPPVPRGEPPPAPVTVATAEVRTVPIQVRANGTVRVISTVSIRPRVSGELTAVHFREGDSVRQGQKLFAIDPRPYETALQQAEATLARNTANLRGAELNLARLERIGLAAVSVAEADTARVAVEAARAAVAADQAAVRSARLQLGFTTIIAPIDGRTGALLVTPGNLVSAADPNPLVVINQLSPIDVQFPIPERYLPAVSAALHERGTLRVEADPRDGSTTEAGELDFIDNAVDTGTGTVLLKAEFPNREQRLWPGQFVDVVLTLGGRADSVLIPTAAVQVGQKGLYVYIVGPGQAAEFRPISVAFETDGLAVVTSGLAGGETVVTEGQLRLAPGVKVEVKNQAPPTPNPSEPLASTVPAIEGGSR